MSKTNEMSILITSELRELIEKKLTAKGISFRRASVDLQWSEGKVFMIVKGYAKWLTLDEMDALKAYLPIHKADLSEEFWYRYNNEKQKLALKVTKELAEKQKEVERLQEKVEAKEEPSKNDCHVEEEKVEPKEEPRPIVQENATLVRLLTNELLEMLDKGSDSETVKCYTTIIIRNLEQIKASV